MDGRKIDRAVCAGPLWSTAGGSASFREARFDTRVSVPIVRDLSDQFCSRKCSGLIGGAKRCVFIICFTLPRDLIALIFTYPTRSKCTLNLLLCPLNVALKCYHLFVCERLYFFFVCIIIKGNSYQFSTNYFA